MDWSNLIISIVGPLIVAAILAKTPPARAWIIAQPWRVALVTALISGSIAGAVTTVLTTSETLKQLAARTLLNEHSTCFDNPSTNYRLCFEGDGNLVVYDRNRPSPGTSNGTPVRSLK
jgi:hypothetical protein